MKYYFSCHRYVYSIDTRTCASMVVADDIIDAAIRYRNRVIRVANGIADLLGCEYEENPFKVQSTNSVIGVIDTRKDGAECFRQVFLDMKQITEDEYENSEKNWKDFI